MSTHAKWYDNQLIFYDGYEHVKPLAPVTLYDDFLGLGLDKQINSTNHLAMWGTVETSLNTAIAVAADIPNGVVDIIVDSDDVAQVGCLHAGDQRSWSVKQGLIFETRLTFVVLPTTGTETVQAVFGLAGDHNTTCDSVGTNLWFRVESAANTTLLWEADDGNTDDDDNSAGTTLVAGTYNIYRIDCRDPANGVKFYVDDALVGTTGDFNANLTSAEAKVQPYFCASKAKTSNNTGTCTYRIDYVRMWQARS